MKKTLTGKVWRLGKNVDTDAIVPGLYLDAPEEEVAKHVFENIIPAFPGEVKKGDIIIADANFGCGSSREQAPVALKRAGVSCIVADSFGRIFFRNAIAIGLPVLTSKGIGASFNTGEQARISFEKFTVENIDRGVRFPCDPLSEEMRAIIESDGILGHLKALIQSGEIEN